MFQDENRLVAVTKPAKGAVGLSGALWKPQSFSVQFLLCLLETACSVLCQLSDRSFQCRVSSPSPLEITVIKSAYWNFSRLEKMLVSMQWSKHTVQVNLTSLR